MKREERAYRFEANRIYLVDESNACIAEVTFPEVAPHIFDIDHTFVDDSLRGQGIAKELVEQAVHTIRTQHGEIRTSCTYASAWMKRYRDKLLAEAIEAFQRNRYEVSRFSSCEEAADYLDGAIDGKRVGFGDSETLRALRLYERLHTHNTVFDPAHADKSKGIEAFLHVARESLQTDVFLLSANAFTAGGQLLNMDGAGNRIAGSLFGHEKTYFIVGTNKLVPDIEAGIDRIHNIAAPQNAKRKAKRTPCAVKGEACFDCASPERICNALVIHYKKMSYRPMEIVIIDRELGL